MKTGQSAHSSINIGLLGFGTVGSSVEKLIRQNGKAIAERTGINLKVKKIADNDPRKKHPLLIKDAYKVMDDPEISVVVEAIGGTKPALDYILYALSSGKHVVTSNKEVMALHMEKIISSAQKHGVSVLFEGCVGGGIPIIGPLSSDLLANQIKEVYGIVNGTTNYILAMMTEEGREFKDVLKTAQNKGFAEADPKLDIEGYDASYKAAILASVAFGARINWKDVYFEGIGKIAQEDIRYAGEIGYVIKLLAVAKRVDRKIEVRVHPTLIPKGHPLSHVSGPMNAIYVRGDAVGELMFYGQGAGGLATASAVVGDIIAVANSKCKMQKAKLNPVEIRSINEISSRYYIRLTAPDRHGVLAGISKAFADEKVSIAAVVQKETIGKTSTIVIVLHEAKEENLGRAVAKLKKLPVVKQVCNLIRVGL